MTVDPSTTLTATEPSDGANTRYRFTGPSTTTTDSICSSGSCSGWSFTDYYQLLNTYQASPDVPNKWTTGGLAIDGTVTEGGATCSTGCTADLTTARANDILIVMIQANPGATVSSVTDTGTAGLTFSTRFACAGSARTLCEYYSSPVSSALASEPINNHQQPERVAVRGDHLRRQRRQHWIAVGRQRSPAERGNQFKVLQHDDLEPQ